MPPQLTVNCSALIIVFIGSVAGMIEPLNVLQLLWVNLIMDTMGALALATEEPNPSLLDNLPHGRDTPLVSGRMWKHIVIQGVWQVRAVREHVNKGLEVERLIETYLFCTHAQHVGNSAVACWIKWLVGGAGCMCVGRGG